MDPRALADFLRNRRARLAPADAGLVEHGPRRTPGLRREEVALLAHISVSYYSQLEQARAAQPSRRVLDALHRALRLGDAERELMFRLAGHPVATDGAHPRADVPRSILDLIGRLPDTAALVVDARYNVLAWNPLAAGLLEDFSALPVRARNLFRRHFLGAQVPGARAIQVHYGLSGSDGFARFAASQLRTAAARYPDDIELRDLIAELRTGSPEFDALWGIGDVVLPRHQVKTMVHPVVGPLELNCDILTIPDRDQHITLFTAEPGSPSQRALSLLGVIGVQTMSASGPTSHS